MEGQDAGIHGFIIRLHWEESFMIEGVHPHVLVSASEMGPGVVHIRRHTRARDHVGWNSASNSEAGGRGLEGDGI